MKIGSTRKMSHADEASTRRPPAHDDDDAPLPSHGSSRSRWAYIATTTRSTNMSTRESNEVYLSPSRLCKQLRGAAIVKPTDIANSLLNIQDADDDEDDDDGDSGSDDEYVECR